MYQVPEYIYQVYYTTIYQYLLLILPRTSVLPYEYARDGNSVSDGNRVPCGPPAAILSYTLWVGAGSNSSYLSALNSYPKTGLYR